MNFVSSYQKNPNFPNRYISPLRLEKFLRENLSDSISEVGTSSLGKSIYMMSMGTGSIKVLAWSQMHGNESNATHAMLDMLETFKHAPLLKKELFSKITLDFIFMLNPDGSEKWERRNAMEIDMNRDFHKLSSKEFPVLKKIAQTGGYMYGLNLHEQRTIFTTDGTHPATLSFLAPSVNFERELTETRKKAMAVLLTFIGLKMIFHSYLQGWGFETTHSLLIIVSILGVSIGASLLFPERKKDRKLKYDPEQDDHTRH